MRKFQTRQQALALSFHAFMYWDKLHDCFTSKMAKKCNLKSWFQIYTPSFPHIVIQQQQALLPEETHHYLLSQQVTPKLKPNFISAIYLNLSTSILSGLKRK